MLSFLDAMDPWPTANLEEHSCQKLPRIFTFWKALHSSHSVRGIILYCFCFSFEYCQTCRVSWKLYGGCDMKFMVLLCLFFAIFESNLAISFLICPVE
ncbi:hypothetical protein OIU84_026866 [Salix udensis]|uniref:Uncharacterized protein n=1 Tax=Salix udensis TaxID=889485 RepID=A0AAD6P9S2_9ROSI|nr:hypothetical protein OIU84_026866 [Salix udensis]